MILYQNEAFEVLSGYLKTDLIAHHVQCILPEDVRDALLSR